MKTKLDIAWDLYMLACDAYRHDTGALFAQFMDDMPPTKAAGVGNHMVSEQTYRWTRDVVDVCGPDTLIEFTPDACIVGGTMYFKKWSMYDHETL